MRPGIVRAVPLRAAPTFAIAAASALIAILASAAGGVAKSAACSTAPSQAAAQERFFALGGSPSRNAAGMDGDGDGVACEGLPGPYAGWATLGYHRERGFLYGAATMPRTEAGDEFACLAGNRHYPEGPRLLRIFKAVPGPDKPVSRELGAEARESSGRLLWKLDRDPLLVGRYYVVFEERIRPSPYKPTECPEFRSREVYLPRAPRATPSPHSGPPRRPPLPARGLR